MKATIDNKINLAELSYALNKHGFELTANTKTGIVLIRYAQCCIYSCPKKPDIIINDLHFCSDHGKDAI